MLNRISVSFEGDHVLVRTAGDKDYEYLEQLWAKVARTCEKHQCFRVLGIANTHTPVEPLEAYDVPRIYRDNNIDHRYRIAWVEKNPDAVDIIDLMESILSNRDLPGRRFASTEEAREWLFGDSDE